MQIEATSWSINYSFPPKPNCQSDWKLLKLSAWEPQEMLSLSSIRQKSISCEEFDTSRGAFITEFRQGKCEWWIVVVWSLRRVL
jgi:hypothetical protein